MARMLTSWVAALALAGAVGSAPKRAEAGDDWVGVLLGLGVLMAVASNGEKERRAVEPKPAERSYTLRDDRSRVFDRRLRILPEDCLRVYDTTRGDLRAFPETCLRHEGVATTRLPDDCALTLRARSGIQRAWDARCLAGSGWRLEEDDRRVRLDRDRYEYGYRPPRRD